MPKLSVIIPVYNVEKYLKQCLDSVTNQTLQDIEIICINDGSKDDSLMILQEYAKKDNRIIVLDKQNAGVSAARNDGIKVAKGEYITFVDGDDYLKLNAYDDIYNHIKNDKPDICVYGHFEDFDGQIKESKFIQILYCFENNQNFSLSDLILKLGNTVWNHWYKRDFLYNNKIEFPLGLVVSEDSIFNVQCFLKKPVVKTICESYYCYRCFREGSTLTSSPTLDKVLEQKRYCDRSDFYLQLPKEQKMIVDLKITGSLMYRYSLLRDEQKTKNFEHLCDYKRYLGENYDEYALINYVEYKRLSDIVSPPKKHFANRIFSVKYSEDKKRKIVTLLGIKIKIKV